MIEVVKTVTYHTATEEFLIVRRSEKDSRPLKWEFPGGGLDNETLENAAKRELYEETGLKPTKLKRKSTSFLEDENIVLKFYTFFAEVESKEVNLSDEHIDFEWVTLEEIKEYDTIKGLHKNLEDINR